MTDKTRALAVPALCGILLLTLFAGCRPRPVTESLEKPRASAKFLEVDPFYEDAEWARVLGPERGRTRIVATVNGEEIRREDLDALLIRVILLRHREGLSLDMESIEKTRAATLSTLIDTVIQKQEAVRIRLDIPREQVDEIFSRYRSAYDSEKEFREALARHGETMESFRRICENEARVVALRNKIEEQGVTQPSEEQILARYGEIAPLFTKIQASQIVFRTTPDMDSEARNRKRQLAESIYSRIRAGESYEELVQEYSEDEATRHKGGIIEGHITLAGLQNYDPNIAAALTDRPVGYVTAPIETTIGFVIFRIEDLSRLTLEQLRNVEVVPSLLAAQRADNFQSWLYLKREAAEIRILDEAIRRRLASLR